jgi:hypothetical protein
MASSSAQPINAMRLIIVLPSHDCDIGYKFPVVRLFQLRSNTGGIEAFANELPNIPEIGYQPAGNTSRNPLASKLVIRAPVRAVRGRRFGTGLGATAGVAA